MKSPIGPTLKGSATLLLLLASACSSDGAVQVIPTAGGGSPGKGGTGGTPGAAGSTAAGSSGASASGSGGMAGAGVAGAGAGGLAAGGSVGLGGLAGTGTGGDTGGGSGGEATAGGSGNGGSGGAPASACAAMDANADTFEEHCYLLVEDAKGWREAEADCDARGGYLVTISSEGELTQEDFDAERTFVWNFAKQMDVWIGATDGLMDNQGGNGTPSTWSNGEMMVLHDWEGGEPSNTAKDCPNGEGMCWEHCGFMWQERGGGWNDEVCAAEKRYICEWDAS